MKLERTSTIVYVALIFVSATLVFSVQPIVGRMLLPKLGGTTVVWNTCLVFFQAALLGGYFYADFLSRKLTLRRQIFVHLGMLIVAGISLPISFSGAGMPQDSIPVVWLLIQLTVSVGFPFLVISASAPLFQSWFSRTGLPGAESPYHLYAASNVGSILSLVAYPFFVEPKLGVAGQSVAWAAGYGVLGILIAVAGWLTWKLSEQTGLREPFTAAASEAVPLPEKLSWCYLAMVPSALLVAVSADITANVAPTPFLWMLPLVMFLSTFVLAFARFQFISISWLGALVLPGALILSYGLAIREHIFTRGLYFTLTGFFLVTLLFHLSLAQRRPAPNQLTTFYLMMSIGGVLGGAFTALLAPVVFDTMIELPLLLLLSVITLPLLWGDWTWTRPQKAVFLALVVLVAVHMFMVAGRAPIGYHVITLGLLLGGAAVGVGNPKRFGILAGITVLVNWGVFLSQREPVFQGRSYFGSYEVTRDHAQTILSHGTTTHGVQDRDPEQGRYPRAYYATKEGVGKVFGHLDTRPFPQKFGAIGLGVGSIAAYIHKGRSIDFFEIDPLIQEIASNPRYFTYIPACGERCNIIIGDGRIEISKQPDAVYDGIVVDAFNSDAVPTHLLTIEAIAVYFKKLRSNGLLMLHLTNGYVRLPEVAVRLADEGGYAYVLLGESVVWMVMARDAKDLEVFRNMPEAWRIEDPELALWTDDYSDILGALK